MSAPATNAGMNTLVAVAIAPCGTGDELSAEFAATAGALCGHRVLWCNSLMKRVEY